MRPDNPPPPEYAFGYKEPPQSGNEINGLGQREQTRARHVFHNATGESLAWKALDDFFSVINPWPVVRHMAANTWLLRRQEGPVAGERVSETPVVMSDQIKDYARQFGAELVGITMIPDEALYEGYDVPYEYAISLGMHMNRDEMEHVPQQRAAVEVMRVYKDISHAAVQLGEKIRSMGWEAKAYGNPNSTELLHIPLAISAGLGQLGKHGSLISKEYGSNFRLAAVLTDLPLQPDQPVDYGVEDLCLSCRRCVIDCPPSAISEEKQMVRGQRKWYVDFDRCVPYFVKTLGCAICIEVCPWSEPGQGSLLSTKLLARRASKEAQP